MKLVRSLSLYNVINCGTGALLCENASRAVNAADLGYLRNVLE